MLVLDGIWSCDNDNERGFGLSIAATLKLVIDSVSSPWRVCTFSSDLISILSLNVKKLTGSSSSSLTVSSSCLFLTIFSVFLSCAGVGFFVNVWGINGLLVNLTAGLFGLSALRVILCLGLGRSALSPDPSLKWWTSVPLTPISDWDRISPYNINTISSRQVMII